MGKCECSDPGCPCCHGQCGREATSILYRVDMQDESGVAFCPGCGDDAMESGVFGDRYSADVDEDWDDDV